MRLILRILPVGLVLALAVLATINRDKLTALIQKVRGKVPVAEAASVLSLGEKAAGGKVHHILGADFDRLVADPDRLVLVDFYADWCAPCRALAPILTTLAAENPDRLLVLKVNVDEDRALAGRLGVSGIPDIRFYRGGKKIDSMVGAAPLEDMRRIVQAHLPAKAAAPVAADAPASNGPLGMVDKLKQAMTKKDKAASAPAAPAAPVDQPAPAPAQPAIEPIKKDEPWMPAGMTRDKTPAKP